MPTTPSSTIVTTAATVAATAPSPASAALALAVPEDYRGLASAALAAVQQTTRILKALQAVTDSADPNAAAIAALLAALV